MYVALKHLVVTEHVCMECFSSFECIYVCHVSHIFYDCANIGRRVELKMNEWGERWKTKFHNNSYGLTFILLSLSAALFVALRWILLIFYQMNIFKKWFVFLCSIIIMIFCVRNQINCDFWSCFGDEYSP
jgi:hypothetical protein